MRLKMKNKITTKKRIRKKRLKKVFRNFDDCAKKFVEQSQEYGEYAFIGGGGYLSSTPKGVRRTAAFFQNDRLYSYGKHFLIAKIDLRINGVKCSVVNFSKTTKTTSGQAWDISRKLHNKKHLVIGIKSELSINNLTTDSELKNIVVKTLRENSHTFIEEIFKEQFTKDSYNYMKGIRRDIFWHNRLVKKLGLNDLIVKIPPKVYQDIKKLVWFNSKRQKDINKRQQGSFYKEKYYYWFKDTDEKKEPLGTIYF